jgi:hypothetical protein
MRKLEAAETRNDKSAKLASNSQLLKVLRAIKIKVPRGLCGGKEEVTIDLFSLVYNNRDTLVTGVTNSANSSEAERFFFFNVIPKLQVHGLADCKQDTGLKYRRGFLNKEGQALFATMEHALLLDPREPGSGSDTKSDKASDAPGVNLRVSSRRNGKTSRKES